MKKTLLITLMAAVAGCTSADKQIFKARQIFDKYPNEAAKYCGEKFPVADSTISIKIDTVRGKTIDYAPVIAGIETLLDSAKETVNRKQSTVTDLSGQLSFTKIQLSKANNLINNLVAQINDVKTNYKPCGIDTIKSTYIKTRANTAKILALTAQVVQRSQDQEKLQNALKVETKSSTHRLYWIIGLFLLIVAYWGFKAYKLLAGGAIAGKVFNL
jgi:hypothetical protein